MITMNVVRCAVMTTSGPQEQQGPITAHMLVHGCKGEAAAHRSEFALTYQPLEPLQYSPPVACPYALHLTHF